jgi:hypothetical protein
MGYRVIHLELATPPTDLDLSLLREVVAFARFNKAAAFMVLPKRYPAALEVTIEGNSSFLNHFTPYLNDSIARIAADIDPNNESLKSIASAIASQLNEQIVDWSDVPTITLARHGRELEGRITGDSSFEQIGDELEIHAKRIESELAKYRKATGPKAWRRRHDLDVVIRIDSLALIVAARRLRRIADDIRKRLPGSHLSKALGRFDRNVPHLVDLRDIAEHIDEYGIGRGRRDHPSGLEPADVFELQVNGDHVTITARQRTVDVLFAYKNCKSLIECLIAAIDRHMLTYLFPPIADFDFIAYTKTGTQIVGRTDESAEHAEARSQITAVINRTFKKVPAERCPECNNWL